MKFIVFEDALTLGQALGKEFVEEVKKNPNAILGLATGSSPLGTYDQMVKQTKEENVDWSKVKTFNLDEYIECCVEDQTYRYFMESNLFSRLGLKAEQSAFPNAKNPEAYDKTIEEEGGIDFQLLGIGRNGHIGFNEPGTAFDAPTHIVDLTASTREANARFFGGDRNKVPTQAVTMGIATIAKSRRIALIANTVDKAEALAKLVKGEADISCPVTALANHPNFEVYLTKDVEEAMKNFKLV